jgi:hypothetical protein
MCLLCYIMYWLKLHKQYNILQNRYKLFKTFLKSLCNFNQYVMEHNKHNIVTARLNKK